MSQSVYEQRVSEARQIQGRLVSGRDTLVPPNKFHVWAKGLWPDKTAAHLAAITGHDERTAKRWLSSEYDPPWAVVLVCLNETFKRG